MNSGNKQRLLHTLVLLFTICGSACNRSAGGSDAGAGADDLVGEDLGGDPPQDLSGPDMAGVELECDAKRTTSVKNVKCTKTVGGVEQSCGIAVPDCAKSDQTSGTVCILERLCTVALDGTISPPAACQDLFKGIKPCAVLTTEADECLEPFRTACANAGCTSSSSIECVAGGELRNKAGACQNKCVMPPR